MGCRQGVVRRFAVIALHEVLQPELPVGFHLVGLAGADFQSRHVVILADSFKAVGIRVVKRWWLLGAREIQGIYGLTRCACGT